MFDSSWWDVCLGICLCVIVFLSALGGVILGCVIILYQHFGTARFAMQSSGQSKVKNDKYKFQVLLNVSELKPEEVQVKVVDNYVVIHGKHKEKSDIYGFIQLKFTHMFTRRYMLPKGTESETVKSSWSPNGILTIEAPKKAIEAPKKAIKAPPANERVIPIGMAPSVEDKK